MNNPSIIDSMVDSMLSIERKDMLIDACRKLFIEKDFSNMRPSVQEELKAIFDEDNIRGLRANGTKTYAKKVIHCLN